MKYSIKLFLCVGLVTSLTACGQPSASSNKDLTKADKDELSTFYNQLSDDKVKELFMQQNKPQCVSEFSSNGVPNAESVCNCIMNDIVSNVGMNNLRKMMLPEKVLSNSEKNQLTSIQMSAMINAIPKCK